MGNLCDKEWAYSHLGFRNQPGPCRLCTTYICKQPIRNDIKFLMKWKQRIKSFPYKRLDCCCCCYWAHPNNTQLNKSVVETTAEAKDEIESSCECVCGRPQNWFSANVLNTHFLSIEGGFISPHIGKQSSLVANLLAGLASDDEDMRGETRRAARFVKPFHHKY